MKVLVNGYAWSLPREMELDVALEPRALENEYSAEANAEVLGRLGALLVEKGVLTLGEANNVFVPLHDLVRVE